MLDPGLPRHDTHPLDVEELRTRVQKALDDVLAHQADVLEEVSPECVPLVESVHDLVAGGKRLRPAFCYWGWRGAGGQDDDCVVRAAAALELFHAAALIHDDVMDRSDTRRGMPAVHRRFATLHRGNSWTGDAERFGHAAAILAGDLCLSWSDEVLSGCGLAPARIRAGKAVFDRMRTQLMGGQYLDMLEQAVAATGGGRTGGRHAGHDGADAGPDPVVRARRVIRFKSAKYTIEHPLLLGGTLAGAAAEVLAAYSAYGMPLGEAFQLRDDVLGVFGDPVETGKPAGDDLREGKRTALVALAVQRADPSQAALVRRLLGDPGLDEAGVARLREVIVDTGARQTVEQLISDLVSTSRAALHRAPVTDEARTVLSGLVDAATSRDA